MSLSSMLTQPRLTVVTAQVDAELMRVRDTLDYRVLVEGRTDLEALFGQLLAAVGSREPTPKTLDLVGHSVAGTSVLQLGDWVIDSARPGVTAFFRELADHEVLPRLGIHAVRLLGCRTAETAQARKTIVALSEILGLEVYGTTGIVFANHYNAQGFDPAWRFLLVGSSDLRREVANSARVDVPSSGRTLDLDSLPATSIDCIQPWPSRVAADASTTRALLRLIRRNEGASMPGLLAMPRCEVLVPTLAANNTFYQIQLVLDGDFVRVYPDGATMPGVLYPVTDPHQLRLLVDRLPLLSVVKHYKDEEAQRTPYA
jgi:hypothetical protein